MAWTVAQFALVFGPLAALVVVLSRLDRWAMGRGLVHRRWRRHARPASAPQPVRRPLQVVAADLRRLSRQLALVPAGAPLVRWKALWTAYDSVLMEAAEQLEIPHELGVTSLGMARDIERLRVLAALEGAGLAVRG